MRSLAIGAVAVFAVVLVGAGSARAWEQFLILVDAEGRPQLEDKQQNGGVCEVEVKIDPAAVRPDLRVEVHFYDQYSGESGVDASAAFNPDGVAVLEGIPGRNRHIRIVPDDVPMLSVKKLSCTPPDPD